MYYTEHFEVAPHTEDAERTKRMQQCVGAECDLWSPTCMYMVPEDQPPHRTVPASARQDKGAMKTIMAGTVAQHTPRLQDEAHRGVLSRQGRENAKDESNSKQDSNDQDWAENRHAPVSVTADMSAMKPNKTCAGDNVRPAVGDRDCLSAQPAFAKRASAGGGLECECMSRIRASVQACSTSDLDPQI